MPTSELDNIASRYHLSDLVPDKYIEDISQHFFCDWIKGRFCSSLRVCELGYGDGVTALQLSSYFRSYTIIEGSTMIFEKATAECDNVEIINSLFEEYEPTESFDLILALHVVEHVDDPLSILDHLKHWLSPEGLLVVLVPNKMSLHRLFAFNMGLISSLDELSERDHIVGHQRVYDFDMLERDLVESGYDVIEKSGFFLKTVPNRMMLDYSRDLIWQLNQISAYMDPTLLANICTISRLKN